MTAKTVNTPAALEHIRALLDQDRPQEALNYILRSGNESPGMQNARGVCLLRLGQFDEAIAVLREIACQGLSGTPGQAPALFQANFALALLRAEGDKSLALAIADQLEENEHPEAARLKAAVRQWKKSLGLLGRLRCRLGLYPARPVPLDERAGAV